MLLQMSRHLWLPKMLSDLLLFHPLRQSGHSHFIPQITYSCPHICHSYLIFGYDSVSLPYIIILSALASVLFFTDGLIHKSAPAVIVTREFKAFQKSYIHVYLCALGWDKNTTIAVWLISIIVWTVYMHTYIRTYVNEMDKFFLIFFLSTSNRLVHRSEWLQDSHLLALLLRRGYAIEQVASLFLVSFGVTFFWEQFGL
jgi:hypothetical protein